MPEEKPCRFPGTGTDLDDARPGEQAGDVSDQLGRVARPDTLIQVRDAPESQTSIS
jgi:hypothetical protein